MFHPEQEMFHPRGIWSPGAQGSPRGSIRCHRGALAALRTPLHPPNPDRRSWGDSDALQGTSQGQDGVKKPLNGILAILEYITFVSWPPATSSRAQTWAHSMCFAVSVICFRPFKKKFLFSTGAPSERGSLDGAWGT